MLGNYGINSNTSANSFLKCIFRKSKHDKASNLANIAVPAGGDLKEAAKQILSVSKVNLNGPSNQSVTREALVKPVMGKRRQKSVGKERASGQ